MNKLNAYEACVELGLNLKGLKKLDLAIELREKSKRCESIPCSKFDGQRIQEAKQSKELEELKQDKRYAINKGFESHLLDSGYEFLIPYKKIPLIRQGGVFCPTCKHYVDIPPHFRFRCTINDAEFSDDRFLWLCSMVTHVRHEHLNYDASYIDKDGHTDYSVDADERRNDYNSYGKKVILIEMGEFIKIKGVGKDIFLKLNNNDDKTIELINKTFKT